MRWLWTHIVAIATWPWRMEAYLRALDAKVVASAAESKETLRVQNEHMNDLFAWLGMRHQEDLRIVGVAIGALEDLANDQGSMGREHAAALLSLATDLEALRHERSLDEEIPTRIAELEESIRDHVHPHDHTIAPSHQHPEIRVLLDNLTETLTEPHLAVPNVAPADLRPILEGIVTCPDCGSRYDLQRDCNIGNKTSTMIRCACSCELEVTAGSDGKPLVKAIHLQLKTPALLVEALEESHRILDQNSPSTPPDLDIDYRNIDLRWLE